MAEVPVSSGFTRAPFGWRSRVHHWVNFPALDRLMANAIASRLGVSLTVANLEHEALKDVLDLTRALLEQGVGHLHMFLHSPSLVPGNSPFVKNEADRLLLLRSIERWVEEVARLGLIQPATVTETADALAPPRAA